MAIKPPHWTVNSCLGAFHSVWVHFGLFRFCTKLGAKRAELLQLMQKFLPWSRIGIFRNECTRPTPLDHKLKYCCISLCLGAFWIVSLLHEAWCKTGWTGAIIAYVFATKSHRNFSQRFTPDLPHWTLSSCFGASFSIWVHLAIFRYNTKLGAKWVEHVQLMHKFVSLLHEAWCKIGWTGAIIAKVFATKSHRNFSQRTHPIHPIGP